MLLLTQNSFWRIKRSVNDYCSLHCFGFCPKISLTLIHLCGLAALLSKPVSIACGFEYSLLEQANNWRCCDNVDVYLKSACEGGLRLWGNIWIVLFFLNPMSYHDIIKKVYSFRIKTDAFHAVVLLLRYQTAIFIQ